MLCDEDKILSVLTYCSKMFVCLKTKEAGLLW